MRETMVPINHSRNTKPSHLQRKIWVRSFRGGIVKCDLAVKEDES